MCLCISVNLGITSTLPGGAQVLATMANRLIEREDYWNESTEKSDRQQQNNYQWQKARD
jgi:hypothetical protein